MPPLPLLESDARSLPSGVVQSLAMSDDGLVLGLHTVLAPTTKVGGVSYLLPDPERVLALLSVVANDPLPVSALTGIERAAEHWRRGDKALANLRLIFAGLPRCDAFADAARLQAAGWLLDHGMTPRALMKELDLETVALDAVAGDLAKYNPDQPRVPAGAGAESGRWTDGNADIASMGASFYIPQLRLRLSVLRQAVLSDPMDTKRPLR